MPVSMYRGDGSNRAKLVKNFYYGISGLARQVRNAYIGIGGQAYLFYTMYTEAPTNRIQASVAVSPTSGWAVNNQITFSITGVVGGGAVLGMTQYYQYRLFYDGALISQSSDTSVKTYSFSHTPATGGVHRYAIEIADKSGTAANNYTWTWEVNLGSTDVPINASYSYQPNDRNLQNNVITFTIYNTTGGNGTPKQYQYKLLYGGVEVATSDTTSVTSYSLSHTPTTTGAKTYTLRVVDVRASANNWNAQVQITVLPEEKAITAVMTVSPTATQGYFSGDTITFTLSSVTGGSGTTPTYNYRLLYEGAVVKTTINSTLTTLSLTHVIPDTGPHSYTVQVEDALNTVNKATFTYSLTVALPAGAILATYDIWPVKWDYATGANMVIVNEKVYINVRVYGGGSGAPPKYIYRLYYDNVLVMTVLSTTSTTHEFEHTPTAGGSHTYKWEVEDANNSANKYTESYAVVVGSSILQASVSISPTSGYSVGKSITFTVSNVSGATGSSPTYSVGTNYRSQNGLDKGNPTSMYVPSSSFPYTLTMTTRTDGAYTIFVVLVDDNDISRVWYKKYDIQVVDVAYPLSASTMVYTTNPYVVNTSSRLIAGKSYVFEIYNISGGANSNSYRITEYHINDEIKRTAVNVYTYDNWTWTVPTQYIGQAIQVTFVVTDPRNLLGTNNWYFKKTYYVDAQITATGVVSQGEAINIRLRYSITNVQGGSGVYSYGMNYLNNTSTSIFGTVTPVPFKQFEFKDYKSVAGVYPQRMMIVDELNADNLDNIWTQNFSKTVYDNSQVGADVTIGAEFRKNVNIPIQIDDFGGGGGKYDIKVYRDGVLYYNVPGQKKNSYTINDRLYVYGTYAYVVRVYDSDDPDNYFTTAQRIVQIKPKGPVTTTCVVSGTTQPTFTFSGTTGASTYNYSVQRRDTDGAYQSVGGGVTTANSFVVTDSSPYQADVATNYYWVFVVDVDTPTSYWEDYFSIVVGTPFAYNCTATYDGGTAGPIIHNPVTANFTKQIGGSGKYQVELQRDLVMVARIDNVCDSSVSLSHTQSDLTSHSYRMILRDQANTSTSRIWTYTVTPSSTANVTYNYASSVSNGTAIREGQVVTIKIYNIRGRAGNSYVVQLFRETAGTGTYSHIVSRIDKIGPLTLELTDQPPRGVYDYQVRVYEESATGSYAAATISNITVNPTKMTSGDPEHPEDVTPDLPSEQGDEEEQIDEKPSFFPRVEEDTTMLHFYEAVCIDAEGNETPETVWELVEEETEPPQTS